MPLELETVYDHPHVWLCLNLVLTIRASSVRNCAIHSEGNSMPVKICTDNTDLCKDWNIA